MTNQEFEDLVVRLEQDARNKRHSYQLKVLSLALLGNAYVAGVLLLVVALLLLLIRFFAVKQAILVGIFLWMTLKALRIKMDPPLGTEINAQQAPEIFELVANLNDQLGAPHFHHVLITDNLNAGVVQVPRLGILGWPKNYLLIGLPLMKSLTVEQLKAVIAHELVHLAKGHARLSNWIYRQRLRWSRLLNALESRESEGSFLFKPFLNWFAPYFNAYSFPMARAQEYEADAISARITSPQAAAEALTSTQVISHYLEEQYWPKIYKQADEVPTPDFAPYRELSRSLAAELDEPTVRAWLNQAMARPTNLEDTHPALCDRLSAISESARIAIPELRNAADRFLGDLLEVITESFDKGWRDRVLPAWRERYGRIQGDRQKLAELNKRFESGESLTLKEAYDRAKFTETVGNNADDAQAQFRALHERYPENPEICFSLGAILLAQDDTSGCALVEQAMQIDEDAIVGGCELLRDYFWSKGKKEEAEAWHQRWVERMKLEETANRERSTVWITDHFEHHGLSEEALTKLRDTLRTIPELHKAYFVKRRFRHLPHRYGYVLGYRVSGFLKLRKKRRVQKVLQQIQESVIFPGDTMIITVGGRNRRFGRKFRRIRGARIL